MQAGARVGALNAGSGGGAAAAVDGGAARKFAQQQQRPPQQGLHQQRQIGTWLHFLAGAVAGAVSKTCTAPLARLTILFQVQASTLQYNIVLQSLPGLDRHGDFVAADVLSLLGGGLAGITAASMAYPLDLVRTCLAAQTNDIYYRGIAYTLNAICRDEGVRGLYKGLGATLLGVGPSIAISFSVYEKLRSNWQLRRPDDNVALVSLACGSLSGITSSTVTFPLDLVRHRMQLEGAAGRARIYNEGLFATLRHIVRNEGFHDSYRGVLPEYYKVVPSVGIVFLTYESLKPFLSGMASDN